MHAEAGLNRETIFVLVAAAKDFIFRLLYVSLH